MSDESQSPGVSLELIGAFYEVLGRRFPNRAATHEQTNQIIHHLGEAERIYETLPEVKERIDATN